MTENGKTSALDIVHRIGRAAAGGIELAALLELIYRETFPNLIDADSFAVALYEAQEGVLRFDLVYDGEERGQPFSLPAEKWGLLGRVLEERTPLIVRDPTADDLPPAPFAAPRSWLALPLASRNQIGGAILAQSSREDAFEHADLSVLQTIADQAAAAIDTIRLEQTMRHRAKEMETLFAVSHIMSTSLDPEQTWRAIFAAVQQVVPYDGIEVCLYDPQQQVLRAVMAGSPTELAPLEEETYEPGEGFSGWIAQTLQPLLVDDVLEEVRAKPVSDSFAGAAIRSYLGVPMILDDRLIGTLEITRSDPAAYTSHHVDLLMSVASQAAAAVERARLFEETRSRAQRLAVVNRIAKAVGATLQLDDLLPRVYEEVAPLFEHNAFFIALYEEASNEVNFVFTVEEGERYPPARYPLGGFSSVVIREKRPLNIRDLDKEGENLPVPVTVGSDVGYPCWLGVPMLLGERVVGVIAVMVDRPNTYGAEEELLLSTIAEQVAIAVGNARLLEQSRTRAEELAVLNELGQALTTRLSLDEVLQEAYRQISRLLDTTNFYIGLYNAESEEITFLYDVSHSELDQEHASISADQGLAGYIIRNRCSVLLEREVGARQAELGVAMVGEEAKSWLGVPLMIGDRVLGAMAVQSFTTPGLYTPHDQELLTTIGSQVAIAIENALLFEETQHALEEVRAASERQGQLLELVRQLSTPLIPITDEVLALPLVGTIDSQRAQQILEVLLEGTSERRARVVIIDITGVPVVDTSVANYLLQATRALRLVGAETVLVGITPEVAQTVVGLGVDLHDLITRSDLQGGVEYALRLLRRRSMAH